MATKKKTEVESTEEVKEVESVETIEETPKKTTKKSTSTKKKAEAEDSISEEHVAAEASPVIKEEPKQVDKKAEPETKVPFTAQVVSSAGIYTFNRPSIEASRGKVIPKGARFTISEVCGPWGKISEDRWIMITGAVVKI